MKIAMCADLHLSKTEKAWSLDVLSELVKKAESMAAILFIGGDLFDSLDDAIALRNEYAEIIDTSKIEMAVWIAGNHDIKNFDGALPATSLEHLSFGTKTTLVYDRRSQREGTPINPLSYTKNKEFELIAIPYLDNPEWYAYASLPEKETKRIILAHGTHADIAVREEAENCLFPQGFEKLFDADFMLLGHIHKTITAKTYVYPGSARIWRKGENEKHGFIIYDTQTDAVEFIELVSGGTYTKINLFIENELPKFHIDAKPYQYIDVDLYGVVQSDSKRDELITTLRKVLEPQCIKFSINSNDLVTTSLLEQNPVWEAFNRELEKQKQNDPQRNEIYDCARRLFIERIIKKIS